MKTFNLKQGSDIWHDLRFKYDTASEAPLMFGNGKSTSRSELIRMKATGAEKEFSDWVLKNLFEKGHEIEAAAREIAEEIIGDELYAVTGVNEELGLLSSFDGLTMCETIGWECKSWNEDKANDVRNGKVPDVDYWQVVQHLVTGVEKELYMVTDGTRDKCEHIWVTLKDADKKKLLAAWSQFHEDVANYEHVEAVPVAVADAQAALPAVTIQVNGEIALIDNLDVFGDALQRYVADINKKPETDQDFANLEAAVKTLKKAEDALLSAESGALAQTESIDVMRRKVANFHETARTTRLVVERLVKSEKENRRNAILQGGKDKLAAHIEKLNARVNNYMPTIAADFVGAMKGKKTMASLQDAVDTTLAHAKIEANEQADLIEANLNLLKDKAADFKFLFSDTRDLIMKAPDDLAAVVSMRISEHEKAEAERLAAEQARIRQEEEARANAKIAADEARIRADEQAKVRQDTAEEQLKKVAVAVEDKKREELQGKDYYPEPLATESASKKHHKAVNNEIAKCFEEAGGFTAAQAKKIVTLIAKGAINNVTIRY